MENKEIVYVSIIVPIYNTDKYLSKCLNSICSQTYKYLQIILVNDGSTDNSKNICLEYKKKDKRIIYIEKNNGGLSSARNAGLDIATGYYVSFIDSDDYIHSDFIETLYNACKNFSCMVSMCGRINVMHDKFQQSNCLLAPEKWESRIAIEKLLIWDGIDGSVCDKLFNRDLFLNKRFPINRIAEDLPILVSILLELNGIVHVGMPLYYYYQRNGSISRQIFSDIQMSVLDSAIEVREMVNNRYPEFRKKADHYYYVYLLYLLDKIYSTKKLIENKKHLNILEKYLNKDFFKIMNNNTLSKMMKFKFILLYLKLYWLKPIIKEKFQSGTH